MEYLIIFVVAGVVGWGIIQRRTRREALKRYAAEHGFVFIGIALPKTFPVWNTAARTAASIENAFAGDKGQREFVVFDAQFKYGRRSYYSETFFAVRNFPEGFGVERVDPSISVERTADWLVFHRPKQSMTVEEIASFVSSF